MSFENKEEIRKRVWSLLEERGVARFPRPIYGRIPNFMGAEKAAEKILSIPRFLEVRNFKVNPDAPQRHVREIILSNGKTLLTPTPRLRRGFLLLSPKSISDKEYGKASTTRGSFKYGKPAPLAELPKIDLIVVGSVAVSADGSRIGKGDGYSELEYGILRELNLIKEETPVITTIHDLQIVDKIPLEEHDISVDVIITPTKIIATERRRPQPRGILWDKLSEEKLREIPILTELRARKE